MVDSSDFKNLWSSCTFIGGSEVALDDVLKSAPGEKLFEAIEKIFNSHSNMFSSIEINMDGKGKPNTAPELNAQGNPTGKLTISLSGVAGIPVGISADGKYQFATYDATTVLIHELSHVFLFLLDGYPSTKLHSEENLANLAVSLSGFNGSLNSYIPVATIPNNSSSFENLLLNERPLLYRAGVKNPIKIFRTGYRQDSTWGNQNEHRKRGQATFLKYNECLKSKMEL